MCMLDRLIKFSFTQGVVSGGGEQVGNIYHFSLGITYVYLHMDKLVLENLTQ